MNCCLRDNVILTQVWMSGQFDEVYLYRTIYLPERMIDSPYLQVGSSQILAEQTETTLRLTGFDSVENNRRIEFFNFIQSAPNADATTVNIVAFAKLVVD